DPVEPPLSPDPVSEGGGGGGGGCVTGVTVGADEADGAISTTDCAALAESDAAGSLAPAEPADTGPALSAAATAFRPGAAVVTANACEPRGAAASRSADLKAMRLTDCLGTEAAADAELACWTTGAAVRTCDCVMARCTTEWTALVPTATALT